MMLEIFLSLPEYKNMPIVRHTLSVAQLLFSRRFWGRGMTKWTLLISKNHVKVQFEQELLWYNLIKIGNWV